MLPAAIFAVYFALMSGLFGYICWTGRPPRRVPEVEPAEVLEPGRDEGGQQAA